MTTASSSFVSGRAWRLAAAAAVVALGAASFQLAQAMPGHGGMGGMSGPMGGPMGGHMMERMLDGVNASAEQRTRIQDIMKAAREDMRKQRDAQQGLRDQAMQLFTQPTIDARAVESLRQQIQAGHDLASKRMTQAMIDAANVLTPDQRKQLADRMTQRRAMMERHRAEREAVDRPSR